MGGLWIEIGKSAEYTKWKEEKQEDEDDSFASSHWFIRMSERTKDICN